MRCLRAGDGAVLAELDDLHQVVDLHRRLANHRPAGILDVIPAARTVLVGFDPDVTSAESIRDWISSAADGPDPGFEAATGKAGIVEIPVHYDGADLAEVCALLQCTERELVALHTATEFTVAFCGFAPGFGYLTGLPAGFRVPRRASPRTRVPAGSVALADEFSGIYPRESPGGWQLIGRTDTVVFALEGDPPALLTPGTQVRFVPVTP
jgi:KipI family sensor histidine kinase inhibitor